MAEWAAGQGAWLNRQACELCTQGDTGEDVAACGPTPWSSLSLWVSVQQAYQEFKASTLSHTFIDR